MVKEKETREKGKSPEQRPKPSSGNSSGVSKSKAGQRDGQSKSRTELKAERAELIKNAAAQQESLESLQKRITETESKIESAGPAESKALRTSLKELQMTEANEKKSVDKMNIDLMEIDQDIMDIDEPDPQEESAKNAQPPALDETDNTGSPLPKEDGAAHGVKIEPSEGAFSQTKPMSPEDDNSPDNDQPYEEASDLADFNKPIQYEDKAFAGIEFLEGGTTLAEANCFGGKLHLNSYGPKNSAMLTWGSSAGDKRGFNVKNIRADPHKQAMETDEDGKLKYKGKIGSIKAIAWRPRGPIGGMRDLLASVKELDPANKDTNSKYIYPFCTVLVDWIGSDVPKPCLIDRSDYKRLSVSGKDSAKRVDWKFFRIACMQVDRFEKWAGNERLGRQISPTPLYETPGPESQQSGTEAATTNTLGNIVDGINLNADGQSTSDRNANPQNTNPQNTNPQNTSAQSPTGQSPTGQSPTGQSPTGQSNGSSNNETQRSPKLSKFYSKWLKRQPIGHTEFKNLDDVYIGKFEAAAFVYMQNLKREGYAVEDDIGADIDI
ncbi:hypothetical protein DTO013E5_9194 [Penicillium roqueforti]|nr:hypothetical protein DTO012A1_8730 [Penicillium roqueforti]KAI2738933.1 hypothetical protein DTO013F2_9487 [Penicillium roqueforti]KAI2756338.1 hypothetical protein DTO006G1_7978 [Penicillium roqueforti]KAI2766386.1 hypothetical protein DTO012A8_8394 [Penicillium roqueforti]KAI3199923.1 hypothetical protein DTO013E5_9194 [Penicillium roqueforti]